MFLPLRPEEFESDLGRECLTPYASDAFFDPGLHVCRNEIKATPALVEVGMLREGETWVFYAVKDRCNRTVETFSTREEAEQFIQSQADPNERFPKTVELLMRPILKY